MSLPTVFTFRAQADGSVTFSADQPFSKELVKIKRSSQIKMCMVAADASDPIASATIWFAGKDGQQGWPFVGQSSANLAWLPEQKAYSVVGTDGKWCFGATLTTRSGTVYTLPDPEMQVGDGPE